jgi:prepilin-type N-terminal cleavage/methylation domain-containing protein
MQYEKGQSGFSLIELIIVVVVVTILSSFALINLRSSQLLAIDNQGKKVIDILDEARQNALNQRQTMRVEINRTRGRVRLIDENTDATVGDDVQVKIAEISDEIIVGTTPNNISNNPATTSPIPIANYQTSNYPLSAGEEKITLRFTRNGRVSVGTDNTGGGGVVTGATIFLTSTNLTNTTTTGGNSVSKPTMVRAVTVLGSSGDTSLLKCTMNGSGDCTAWYK